MKTILVFAWFFVFHYAEMPYIFRKIMQAVVPIKTRAFKELSTDAA